MPRGMPWTPRRRVEERQGDQTHKRPSNLLPTTGACGLTLAWRHSERATI